MVGLWPSLAGLGRAGDPFFLDRLDRQGRPTGFMYGMVAQHPDAPVLALEYPLYRAPKIRLYAPRRVRLIGQS